MLSSRTRSVIHPLTTHILCAYSSRIYFTLFVWFTWFFNCFSLFNTKKGPADTFDFLLKCHPIIVIVLCHVMFYSQSYRTYNKGGSSGHFRHLSSNIMSLMILCHVVFCRQYYLLTTNESTYHK